MEAVSWGGGEEEGGGRRRKGGEGKGGEVWVVVTTFLSLHYGNYRREGHPCESGRERNLGIKLSPKRVASPPKFTIRAKFSSASWLLIREEGNHFYTRLREGKTHTHALTHTRKQVGR